MEFRIHHLKPTGSQRGLRFIAGITWLGVGIMLISMALYWKFKVDTRGWVLMLPAILAGWMIYQKAFQNMAQKNKKRIASLPAYSCVFAFITWKSYLIIITMVAMGITLRHSSLPKQYLSPVYLTMGLALFLSSFLYFTK